MTWLPYSYSSEERLGAIRSFSVVGVVVVPLSLDGCAVPVSPTAAMPITVCLVVVHFLERAGSSRKCYSVMTMVY